MKIPARPLVLGLVFHFGVHVAGVPLATPRIGLPRLTLSTPSSESSETLQSSTTIEPSPTPTRHQAASEPSASKEKEEVTIRFPWTTLEFNGTDITVDSPTVNISKDDSGRWDVSSDFVDDEGDLSNRDDSVDDTIVIMIHHPLSSQATTSPNSTLNASSPESLSFGTASSSSLESNSISLTSSSYSNATVSPSSARSSSVRLGSSQITSLLTSAAATPSSLTSPPVTTIRLQGDGANATCQADESLCDFPIVPSSSEATTVPLTALNNSHPTLSRPSNTAMSTSNGSATARPSLPTEQTTLTSSTASQSACLASPSMDAAVTTSSSSISTATADTASPAPTDSAAGDDASSSSPIRCAVEASPDPRVESDVRSLVAEHEMNLSSLQGKHAAIKVSDLGFIHIPVYWHVISNSKGEGRLSDKKLAQQLKVLNRDFASSKFNFTLVKTNRIANDEWFKGSGTSDKGIEAMKRALRQGGPSDLNLYSVNFSDGTLGFATFPWDYAQSPKDDGVIIKYATVPGGDQPNYNGGRTAVHEVGHWLGLYHTFQGGCGDEGDFVGDTTPQASPSKGCPAGRRSCKNNPSVDPIHNFMDYSFDSCMNEFTTGQAARMQALVARYRSP